MFDAALARRAVDFFRLFLRHHEGQFAGQLFRLRPWQEAIVGNLFGWVRTDGTRRYREAYIEVPRKNGKTTLAAGIALLLLFCDHEHGAQIYSAASEREQAALVFNAARAMVEQDTQLSRRSHVFRNTIVVPALRAKYKSISSESRSKHGFNAHGVVIDELHAITDRDLVDVLLTSMGSRRQPLAISITTAGWDRFSICWEKHEYAQRVRDGAIDDPAFLPVIYAAGEEDDWRKRSTWRRANPNLGVTVNVEYLERECRKAIDVPRYENTFKRLFLNIWTEQEERWLPVERWHACCDRSIDFDALHGMPCWVGLDLSSTTDLTALVLVFPQPVDDPQRYVVMPRFWLPAESIERRTRQDRVPYDVWAREGHLIVTEGSAVDYDRIRRTICELAAQYEFRMIAADPWNAQQLLSELDREGLPVFQHRQGFASMSGAMKTLEMLILDRRLRHDGHPVLTWMVGNVAVETDAAGNIKPSKRSSRERIDGVVAMAMAAGQAAKREHWQRSMYNEEEGEMVL